MPYLAIETSSARGSLALMRGRLALAESTFSEGMEHGREVAPRLKELLAGAGLTSSSLAGLAVGLGPGSFTGTRVGVTAAKTLAFALRLPVVAESSLRVMAANALSGADQERRFVATLLDGRQDFLYGALFEVDGECVRRLLPDQVGDALELLGDFAKAGAFGGEVPVQGVPAHDVPRITAVGGGADRFLERIQALSRESHRFERGPRDWDLPHASRLGFLTGLELERIQGRAFDSEELHRLQPAYLRATEAERKLALRSKGV